MLPQKSAKGAKINNKLDHGEHGENKTAENERGLGHPPAPPLVRGNRTAKGAKIISWEEPLVIEALPHNRGTSRLRSETR